MSRPLCRRRAAPARARLERAARFSPRIASAGLLLLEDFGDDTYTRLLAAAPTRPALYALAVDMLVALQRASRPSGARPAAL